MSLIRKSNRLALLASFALAVAASGSHAEDIDLFIGASGGSAAAPKVMILMDNSNNWVSDLPNGKSKFLALSAVMNSIKNPVEVGLSTFSYSGPPYGSYVRFAPRDMNVAANKAAFQKLLGVISADANVTKETGNNKAEAEALYEIYKYYASLAPRAGTLAQNKYADATGNIIAGYPDSTGAAVGMTTGFAFKADGTYNSTATTCARNYIIYIVANNSSGGSLGAQIYEGVDAGPRILPAPGSPDTWADEWARFLYRKANPQIVTYVLDAYFPDDNQDAGYSLALQGMAKQGGGSYKHVRNQAEIETELLRIFAEIQSVNSVFASASLPVSATNRAQDQNQVFIGMFRPDPDAKPRWFGNMKRYQLIDTGGGNIDLGDAKGLPAVNPTTGFLTECATSFWTTDSGSYWQNVPVMPVPSGSCPSMVNKFSDSPDGPFVEKGAAGEVIRKGNDPPTTDATPTFAVNRTIHTLSGASLAPFTVASSGLPANVVDFISGKDVNDENANTNKTETRPSLHGDVIHSRPLPINYSTTVGTVYYGANDGMLRAVDSSTGKERWAFVAPEFYPSLARLMNNSPVVAYPNMPPGVLPAPTPKDYSFDGSIGIFQNLDNTKVWIYPTMRRGGRMVYGFDVTNTNTPTFKWRAGCNAAGCSTDLANIGQTWSQPQAALIKGYSATAPVLVMGGGYDGCEDADTPTPACASPKGAAVYILDADTGTVVASFATLRSVAAEVALVDVDNDGYVDFAYAVDTGGNIYRIDFVAAPPAFVSKASALWTMNRVAYTSGANRKFLFAPALFYSGKGTQSVYVAVGSGDREHPLETNYPFKTPVINRFYVYVDALASTTANNLDDLGKMSDFTATPSCTGVRILPGAAQKGWFLTLNQNGVGEQVVTSAAIAGGMVTFSTNRPIPKVAGTCATALGEARGYFLDLLSGSGSIGVKGSCGGTPSATFVGGGMPPSPVLGTVPINGQPRTVLVGAVQKGGGASSGIQSQLVTPSINPVRRRIYWYPSGSQ
jgi:type IV pilus assembly protein PilY1